MPGKRGYAETVIGRAQRATPSLAPIRRAVAPEARGVGLPHATRSVPSAPVATAPAVARPVDVALRVALPSRTHEGVRETPPERSTPSIAARPPDVPGPPRPMPQAAMSVRENPAPASPPKIPTASDPVASIVDGAAPVARGPSVALDEEHVPVTSGDGAISTPPPARLAKDVESIRVSWPDDVSALALPMRQRVEREVVRTARAAARRDGDGRGSNAAATKVVDVRVDRVIVKLEAPAAPPAAPAAPASRAAPDTFASYFLRRSITGF